MCTLRRGCFINNLKNVLEKGFSINMSSISNNMYSPFRSAPVPQAWWDHVIWFIAAGEAQSSKTGGPHLRKVVFCDWLHPSE